MKKPPTAYLNKHVHYFLNFVFLFALAFNTKAQQASSDNYRITGKTEHGLTVQFTTGEYIISENLINGAQMKNLSVAGMFLPNEAGAPDLPNNTRFIAVPNGAKASLKVVSYQTETIQNIDIAPAPVIPLDLYDNPLEYKADAGIYSKNEWYPAEPFKIFESHAIRGVDAVQLGVTPFQYNPVTKTLLVYKEVKMEIKFEGTSSQQFGNTAYRSRWWDPIMEDLFLNYDQLPKVDYNKQIAEALRNRATPGCEYAIVIPDGPDFLPWADSIRKFRTEQGILTEVYTLSTIGANTTSAIKNWLTDAYKNWTIKPGAVLFMADYGSNSTSSIISNLYKHPDSSFPDFASDNFYADVTGDDMPDMALARITGNNAAQLKTMCTKFLNYERNPPMDAAFYNKPITAIGWQDDRWFQLGGEIIGGYLKSMNKTPTRVNDTGSPASNTGNNVANTGNWSTASNTTTIINYFGPGGLNYIPAKPGTMGGFSGGNATNINTAINNGAYMLLHRDHGFYFGWGEPSYSTSNISSLTNVKNRLPFIFSINCQTGAFHRTAECFSEKFHRHTYNGQNSGALGMIAATEVSYSFVNDVFIFGMFDNMWPNFMPANGTSPASRDMRPAFANVAGKYFLKQSSWSGSSNKQITYRLFHMHGDAFQWFYSEVPQSLSVIHNSTVSSTATSFAVNATAGSFIAITESTPSGPVILGTATGTGASVNIPLTHSPGGKLLVTVTKQNYLRYSAAVSIVGTVSIKENKTMEGFTVYPNPADNTCTIEGVSVIGKINYSLHDMAGRELKSGQYTTNNGAYKLELTVQDLPAGVYFIRVQDEKNIWIRKLTIQ